MRLLETNQSMIMWLIVEEIFLISTGALSAFRSQFVTRSNLQIMQFQTNTFWWFMTLVGFWGAIESTQLYEKQLTYTPVDDEVANIMILIRAIVGNRVAPLVIMILLSLVCGLFCCTACCIKKVVSG